MPKRRVPVSLRKPGQPPAPESGASGESSSASEAVVNPGVVDPRVVNPSEVDPRAGDPVRAVPHVATAEAFVNGVADPPERPVSGIPPVPSDGWLKHGSLGHGPEGYREITLYLPDQLVRELLQYCLEHNIEMSRMVTRAIQQYFQAGRVLEQGVSAAARLLLSELARWARTLLGGQGLGGQKRRGESVSTASAAAS
jgi:hypothetical protein